MEVLSVEGAFQLLGMVTRLAMEDYRRGYQVRGTELPAAPYLAACGLLEVAESGDPGVAFYEHRRYVRHARSWGAIPGRC